MTPVATILPNKEKGDSEAEEWRTFDTAKKSSLKILV